MRSSDLFETISEFQFVPVCPVMPIYRIYRQKIAVSKPNSYKLSSLAVVGRLHHVSMRAEYFEGTQAESLGNIAMLQIQE